LSEELHLAVVFGLGALLSLAFVPAARTLALRTGFLDHPVSYKAHGRSTPYLGGLAVIAATCLAALVLSDAVGDYAALIWGALALSAVGTLDDRIGLKVAPRLLVQLGAASGLYIAGYHWEFGLGAFIDFAVTVFWVVGVVNAFNLMDNLDGAIGSVTAAAATGVALLAAWNGLWELASLMMALSAASLAFLVFNLAKPAKIFLGDGGSTPIGYLVAGALLTIPEGPLGAAALPASLPLAGLVILDTTLVVVSRRRRSRPVLSGARDHLTHRLLAKLGSPRRVALALASVQGALAILAIALHESSPEEVVAIAACYFTAGLLAVALLETPDWRSDQMRQQVEGGEEVLAERRGASSGAPLESTS
jgi:UDP-GlcNAc:undecaprenyl-phosphate GlcNAc-1-phosphate transferase